MSLTPNLVRPTDEVGTVNSPMTDPAPSPQALRLHQILDSIAGPSYVPVPPAGPFSSHGAHSASGSSGSHTMPGIPPVGAANYISPGSSAGRGNEAFTPEGSKGSQRPPGFGGPAQSDDVIELPKHQQTLFDGEPVTMTPMFADQPAWLTENTTSSIPMYHRKSSDGATLRLMIETLASQGNSNINIQNVDSLDSQDPLDASPRPDNRQGGAGPSVGPSPFGSLDIPNQQQQQNGNKGRNGKQSASSVKRPVHRRSTTILTSWTHAPRILVVEDDLVYRQLSSKFLEKFGCVIETVEDAQQAIEKMNHTKYDLVLMDIFFGPSMDG